MRLGGIQDEGGEKDGVDLVAHNYKTHDVVSFRDLLRPDRFKYIKKQRRVERFLKIKLFKRRCNQN